MDLILTIAPYLASGAAGVAWSAWRLRGDRTLGQLVVAIAPIWRPKAR